MTTPEDKPSMRGIPSVQSAIASLRSRRLTSYLWSETRTRHSRSLKRLSIGPVPALNRRLTPMTLEQWYAELLGTFDNVIDQFCEELIQCPCPTDDRRAKLRSYLCELTVKYDIIRERYLAD